MAEQMIPQEPLFDPGRLRAMTPLEGVTLVERMVIAHARLTPLMTELDKLANYSGSTPAGSPHCLAILGESGVGKTTLVRSWITSATAQLQTSGEGEPTRPYRYISFSPQATPKALLASFLTELGDAVPPRGAEWAMMERLRHLVRASSVRILFVDDLHHLVNKDTQRIRYACVEMLEHMIAQTGLSMVFLGSLRETEPILQVSPRLERLVGAPSILRPFEWNRENPTTIQEFRYLLETIDLHLPFEPSGLSEEETAHRIYYATDGIISWIMKLVRYAAMSAIEAQETTLNRRRLAEAYETCVAHTTLGVGKLNPFTDPDFHEVFRPRNGGRTNVKRVRISARYWKEGDHHDQGKS